MSIKKSLIGKKNLSINLLSSAHRVKATGPGSAWREFLKHFEKEPFASEYQTTNHRKSDADFIHMNTPDPRYKWHMRRGKYHGVTIFNVLFIPHTHTDNSYDHQNWIHRLFLKKIISWSNYFLTHVDELVVVNPMFINDLVDIGVDRSKITYIPNVVDSSGFSPVSNVERLELRKKYNLFKDEFIVVSVGQLQTRKGVKDFIEVAKKLPKYKFIWLGSFAFKKMSHGHKEIEQFVSNPPDNVFFKGRVSPEEVNDYLNVSDLFFMPALNELFPMSILEAANVNVPMLLRDLPEYAEIFNFTKYLKANNNADFAKIIDKLATNKESYAAAKGYSQAIAKKYDHDIICQEWDSYYNRLSTKYKDRINNRHNKEARKEARKRYK